MIDIENKNNVIFDFGDTLASTVPTYPERIRLSLNSLGYKISENEFLDAYQFADYTIYKNYIKNGNLNSGVYRNSFFTVIKERFNIDTDTEELKKQVFSGLKDIGYKRELLPDAAELLELLKTRNMNISIISNNDGHTFEKCRELGIGNYFEIVVDSTNVGMVKPDRNIYRYALDKLNIDAEKAVHIGDLYGADILGGMNSGLDVVWFNHRSGKNYEDLQVTQFRTIKQLIDSI